MVVALIGIVTLLIAFFWQIRREWRSALFAWFWLALALAPAVLFIPFHWMSASPRVLYLASVAIAWLWADLIVGLAGRGGSQTWLHRLGPALVLLAALLLLYQGTTFVRAQTQMYVLAGSAIDGLVEGASGAAERALAATVINFPSWLAPPQKWYALGEEGVLVLGAYSELEKLIALYLGRPMNIAGVSFHDIRQEVPYHSGLTGPGPDWTEQEKTGREILTTVYTADDILVEPAGVLAADPPQRQPLAAFEGTMFLLDAQAASDQGVASLTLTWQAQQVLPPNVTVFAHLVDANGQLLAQVDGDSLAGTYPFWLWPPSLVVADRRTLPAGNGVAFRVGLYDRATGARLAAQAADGQSWPDDAVTVEIVPTTSGE